MSVLLLTHLEEVGTDWSRLELTGADWSRREPTGADGSRLEGGGGGWSRLEGAGGRRNSQEGAGGGLEPTGTGSKTCSSSDQKSSTKPQTIYKGKKILIWGGFRGRSFVFFFFFFFFFFWLF